MKINGLDYVYDKIEQINRPTLYPGENTKDWELPEYMSTDFHRLNAILESKYSKEYLKICAFYNKMFPTLKASEWAMCSYNTQPFTIKDQERGDTGAGISTNYLKQIVDQITSRLGTVQFVPYLLSEDQNFEYIVYKDEVERILRMYVNKDRFNRTCIEAFHDSAVLGYSHVFIDPYTGNLVKANDYEVGMFESQMNKHKITQMVYRDYAFPVKEAYVYLGDDPDEDILQLFEGKVTTDFCMYFDCNTQSCVVSFDGRFLTPIEYPFDEVLIATMQWDIGVSAVTTTSLFDLLYPLQREINKINAKQQQLIRMYKGATPVFNSDVELAMKSITNGAGECLYVDSQRPLDSLMTVINPTPLDPQLNATVQEYKSAMYELAGIQNASFDMDNMRSAAAVVALDQTRDAVFQAQLSALSDFIARALKLYIYYNAEFKPDAGAERRGVDWDSVKELIDTAYISLKPVHINDPLSDEDKVRQEPIDYVKLCTARIVLDVIKGHLNFDTIPYYLDPHTVTVMLAMTIVKFEALGIEIPDTIHRYLISAFVEAIKEGEVQL